MAVNTDPRLQNQVIYSVYVRAHTPEGTFRAVIPDLDRIKALGTDIVWFLPIHPIGVEGKKGSLGCPYANRDYRTVNPAYGTMDDFKALVDEIHKRGMKCMIDVVYNHTSPDSTLYAAHPEFFYHGPDGKPGNKMGDWADVIDLDYRNRDLWAYQIDSLVMWAQIVDGFRCDVASFVPVEFWRAARQAVAKVNPDCIWLAETVHQSYGCLARRSGVYSALDYDAFSAFDMEYEYDVREAFDQYLAGKIVLSHYLDMVNFQEATYPANYNKLRFLENHDQPRIASFVRDEASLKNFTAMLYFEKGTTLIYAGQEFEDDHVPSLFEREPIDRKPAMTSAPICAASTTSSSASATRTISGPRPTTRTRSRSSSAAATKAASSVCFRSARWRRTSRSTRRMAAMSTSSTMKMSRSAAVSSSAMAAPSSLPSDDSNSAEAVLLPQGP